MRSDSLKVGCCTQNVFSSILAVNTWSSARQIKLRPFSHAGDIPWVSLSVMDLTAMTLSLQSHRRKPACLKKPMRAKRVEQPCKLCRLNEVTDCRRRSLLCDCLLPSEMKSNMTDDEIESMLESLERPEKEAEAESRQGTSTKTVRCFDSGVRVLDS